MMAVMVVVVVVCTHAVASARCEGFRSAARPEMVPVEWTMCSAMLLKPEKERSPSWRRGRWALVFVSDGASWLAMSSHDVFALWQCDFTRATAAIHSASMEGSPNAGPRMYSFMVCCGT